MGKLDQFRREAADNVGESIGRGIDAGGSPIKIQSGSYDQYAGLKGLGSAKRVPLDSITRDPSQPREIFPEVDLAELADSIRARGVLQPIRLRWDADLGKYVVIAGERRFRAARMAGARDIPAIIQEGVMTRAEILIDQLAENLIRLDLQPIEQGKAFKRLMDENGWSARRLAEELHIDNEKVNRAVRLLGFSDEVQAAVAEKRIAPTTVIETAKLADPEEQSEVVAMAIEQGLSRAEVGEEVNRRLSRSKGKVKGKGGRPKTLPTSRALKAGAGFKVTIENRRGVDLAGALAALEEIAARLRAEQGGEAEAA